MKKRRTIFAALIALLVLTMGVNFNAEAQLGGLLNKAKDVVGSKKRAKETKNEIAQLWSLAIPQPDANAPMVTFTMKIDGASVGVGTWWPAKNELNVSGPNIKTVVCTIDPATGKVTSSSGEALGSISEDGTIVSPNLGTLKLKSSTECYKVIRNDETLGAVTTGREVKVNKNRNGFSMVTVGSSDDKSVSNSLVAYVYFGLVFTENYIKDCRVWQYTSEQLDDMIEWNNDEAIAEILKYESSLPCAGFKEEHPEFKNCKIGGIGLMSNGWSDGDRYYMMDYWVVYELTDGRNVGTFSTARKMFRYGDVESRWRQQGAGFFEVTDWQRK